MIQLDITIIFYSLLLFNRLCTTKCNWNNLISFPSISTTSQSQTCLVSISSTASIKNTSGNVKIEERMANSRQSSTKSAEIRTFFLRFTWFQHKEKPGLHTHMKTIFQIQTAWFHRIPQTLFFRLHFCLH